MTDYFGYKEKVCVVTGAASGMGRSAVEMLVEMGASVYALDIQNVTVTGITAYIPVDLSKKDEIDAAFAKLPEKIDCFFGVAGVSLRGAVETVAVDYLANRYMTDTYLASRMTDGGRIVYVSSNTAARWSAEPYKAEFAAMLEAESWDDILAAAAEINKTIPDPLFYILAKRALNFYASTAAYKLADRNIRVNVVLPTSTTTPMMEQGIAAMGNDEQYRVYNMHDKPYATPEVMAKAMIYLNSDFADFVSGNMLFPDWAHEAGFLTGLEPDMMGMTMTMMAQYMK